MALKLVRSNMEEVTQAAQIGGAAAMSGGKVLAAAGAGMTLATIVVMAMTNPASRKELVIALICTVVASFCGGAAVIQYFDLQNWAHDFFGLVAMMGIAFTCGLPGWVVVRAAFVWSEKGLPALIAKWANK